MLKVRFEILQLRRVAEAKRSVPLLCGVIFRTVRIQLERLQMLTIGLVMIHPSDGPGLMSFQERWKPYSQRSQIDLRRSPWFPLHDSCPELQRS